MWTIIAFGIAALCGILIFFWKLKTRKTSKKKTTKKQWDTLSLEEKRNEEEREANLRRFAWYWEVRTHKLPRFCPNCHKQNYGQDPNGFPTDSKWELVCDTDTKPKKAEDAAPKSDQKSLCVPAKYACPHCGYTVKK